MFCPLCKAEYRPGFTWCSDCDVGLIYYLPIDAQNSADSKSAADSCYVVVASVQAPLEESQICSFLQANEIPTLVRAEGIRKAYGIYINGIGAVKILVPSEFAVAALDLLDRANRGELEIPAADGENSTTNGSA